MIRDKKKSIIAIFIATLIIIIAIFGLSMLRNNAFNNDVHNATFTGDSLFALQDDTSSDVYVRIAARSNTWTKIIDINNEGLEEPDFQAFTYDFYICNNTNDEVSDFTYTFTFDREVFLMSAWNGSLEVHQADAVDTIPDLREFDPNSCTLDTVDVGGEILVHMQSGDFFVYYPNAGEAMEIPIEPEESAIPGFIMYVPMGEDISGSTLQLNYTFHRELINEPLFRITIGISLLWVIALITVMIIELQLKKYNERHEHDNEMIKEAIETFTGFIDAKDPYTNGHSNRVAEYTRMIAEEMGFEGEELDRIYYVALLHDCGKIGVPDSILTKPGSLTDEEFEKIKSHTVNGGEILDRFKSLNNVGEGAMYHHERYDGKGYPKGLKGEEIPLIARMICVADSFDAMNSNRVYRKKLTKEAILKEIETHKGTQFDPEMADILLKLIKSGKIDMSE